MKKIILKIWLWISIFLFVITIFSINNNAHAQDMWFEIIPDSTSSNSNIGNTVDNIWKWWEVWDRYKDAAYWKKNWNWNTREWSDMSLWDQFASGIMTWDTILDYAVYLVKFIWQLALLVWALWFIYFWYKKATEHIKFGGTLWNIVIWILIISFAYVIIKMVWSMFVS